MTWTGSTRRARLPADWNQRRTIIATRAGGQCEARPNGQRCTDPGSECDHVINNDDHSLANLQWLCTPHHKAKTQREAQAAKPKRRRAAEPHPGT